MKCGSLTLRHFQTISKVLTIFIIFPTSAHLAEASLVGKPKGPRDPKHNAENTPPLTHIADSKAPQKVKDPHSNDQSIDPDEELAGHLLNAVLFTPGCSDVSKKGKKIKTLLINTLHYIRLNPPRPATTECAEKIRLYSRLPYAMTSDGELYIDYPACRMIDHGVSKYVYRSLRRQPNGHWSQAAESIMISHDKPAISDKAPVNAPYHNSAEDLAQELRGLHLREELMGHEETNIMPKPYSISKCRGREGITELRTYEELQGGNLKTAINRPNAKELTLSLFNALAHLQKHKIIHADLRPANIFVNLEGKVRVGDFGIAYKISEKPTRVNTHLLSFLTPQQLLGHEAIPTETRYAIDYVAVARIIFWAVMGYEDPLTVEWRQTYASQLKPLTRDIQALHLKQQALTAHSSQSNETAHDLQEKLTANEKKVTEIVLATQKRLVSTYARLFGNSKVRYLIQREANAPLALALNLLDPNFRVAEHYDAKQDLHLVELFDPEYQNLTYSPPVDKSGDSEDGYDGALW